MSPTWVYNGLLLGLCDSVYWRERLLWMGGQGSFGLDYGKEPAMQRSEQARWRNKQCEDSDGKEHHLCVHAKLLSCV